MNVKITPVALPAPMAVRMQDSAGRSFTLPNVVAVALLVEDVVDFSIDLDVRALGSDGEVYRLSQTGYSLTPLAQRG